MKTIAFTLTPTAPFRLDLTVWTLRRRDRNIIDAWDGQTYRRVITSAGRGILVQVRQSGGMNSPLLHVIGESQGINTSAQAAITCALERLLGLTINMKPFYQFASHYPKFHELALRFKGMKPPRFNSVFEALVNGIACQQFSLEAGLSMINRLSQRTSPQFERNGETYYPFPAPRDLAITRLQSIRALGFSANKSLALKILAREISANRFDPESLSQLTSDEARSRLLELEGIGRWTAEYVLLRGLGRLDVFPGDDVGARGNLARWLKIKGTMDYLRVEGTLKKWAPYKGLIYFHLLLDGLERSGQMSEISRAA